MHTSAASLLVVPQASARITGLPALLIILVILALIVIGIVTVIKKVRSKL